MVYRMKTEIRVVDIALLPEFRGKGVGGRWMREVMDEAEETGRSVTIHVEKMNPALRFYNRLGFKPVEDKGIYWFMEWKPPAQPSSVS
jgi:ribosomal protein S18 acetylase RimI-like enzyme